MNYPYDNFTVVIGLDYEKNYSFLQVLGAHSVLTKYFLTHTYFTKSSLFVFGWLNFFLGTYFKIVIYRYIFNQYKTKELTCINVITLILCIVQNLNTLLYQIDVTMLFLTESYYNQIVGMAYCIIYRLLPTFESFFTPTASLGIAIHRILLLKKPLFVRETIGQKLLMVMLLLVSIFISATLTVFLNFIDSQQLVNETCMLALTKETLDILDEYQESLGSSRIYASSIWVSFWVAAGMICILIAELIIYIIFFHHLYKHDNTSTLRRLLGSAAIKSRNKRNALTFFSNFCCFVFEVGFILSIIIFFKFSTSENNISTVIPIIKMSSFTLSGLISIMTSENLSFTISLTFVEQNIAMRENQ